MQAHILSLHTPQPVGWINGKKSECGYFAYQIKGKERGID